MNLKNQPELVKRAQSGGLFRPIKYQYQMRVDGELVKSLYTTGLLSEVEARVMCQKFAHGLFVSPNGVKIVRVKKSTGKTMIRIKHKGKVS